MVRVHPGEVRVAGRVCMPNYAGVEKVSVGQEPLRSPVCHERDEKGVDGGLSGADVGGGAVDDRGELVDGRRLSHVDAVGRGPEENWKAREL